MIGKSALPELGASFVCDGRYPTGLVFSTPQSLACCSPRVSFLSPGIPRRGFMGNVLLGKAMQLLCKPEIVVYRAVRQS